MKFERFAYVFLALAIIGSFIFLYRVSHSGPLPRPNEVSQTASGPERGKSLVFGDDFNSSVVDRQKWATCYDWKLPSETGCTNNGNLEQQWYSDAQLSIKNGSLIITADHTPIDVSVQGKAKTFEYRSGMVNTGPGSTAGAPHWTGTYGYFEARIKVQKGQGIWPAFWLLPADREWPPEIDIMEFIGSKPGEILQTYHWGKPTEQQKDESVIKGTLDYASDWHTYGIDWQPNQIDWYIDGKKTKTAIGTNVPSEPMEVILNLAVGGTLPGSVDGSTPFPRTMEVDYVRVFQSNDQLRPGNK